MPPRLLPAGHEWSNDAALLSNVLPRSTLAASTTGRAGIPCIMVALRGNGVEDAVPPEQDPNWPGMWRSSPMGLLSSEVWETSVHSV